MSNHRSWPWVTAIIALALLTPTAAYFFFRASSNSCGPWTILNFGMPWLAPWPSVVQATCLAVVLAFLAVAIAGIWRGRGPRIAGIVTLSIGVVCYPILVGIALLASFFGDAGPNGFC
jgi:hypothetical protein